MFSSSRLSENYVGLSQGLDAELSLIEVKAATQQVRGRVDLFQQIRQPLLSLDAMEIQKCAHTIAFVRYHTQA